MIDYRKCIRVFWLVTVYLFVTGFPAMAQDTINLSGDWQVQLEKPVLDTASSYKLSGEINLPGSLAENGYGIRTEGSDYGVLTPEFKYIGKVRYSREIEIPETWADKSVEIFLERVLWESVVAVDGKELSRQDALGTPHIHRLGKLSPGKHRLSVMVDNGLIHNIGDKGHAYGEYTQSIWNGIVGRMEMKAYDPIRILSLKISSSISKDELKLKTEVLAGQRGKGLFRYKIASVKTGRIALRGRKRISTKGDTADFELSIPLKGRLKKWSEFTPEVYELTAELESGGYSDSYSTEFGHREISHDGTKVTVNGQPVFLRGNLDCVHFPLTGYASCELDDWERIFKIYKSHGLNHVRFHSWCPPEAAFKAANRVGIYIQAEASIWIDWWMSVDMKAKGRPEMDTKGHPKGLGYDKTRDRFVIAEMNRIVNAYGNHPSFAMFCIGNELGNSNFEVMGEWVDRLKKKYPGRLYALSTARTITEVDDYNATHYIQGIGRTRGLNGPHTDWDFDSVYSKMNIPIIAHEIGQWPVYPRWSEIGKYTGVLKARNFESFREQARKNGVEDQDEDFAKASGALNQIMYKYETESFLRTPSCAGVQLLSMQDYQGQGEALIGWLDAFWDSKGIIKPENFREHFDTAVPLLRMKKFVWENDEIFRAKAQLSYHGDGSLRNECAWRIQDGKGALVAKGTFGTKTFAPGTVTDLGDISVPLKKIEQAEKLTVSLKLEGTRFQNQWDIWVYPHTLPATETNKIHVTDRLDTKALEVLRAGGNVLLDAHRLGDEANSVKAQFYPLYWSLTFFPGQGKTNIGLLLRDHHPAFSDFPTSFHSDWQWEMISESAKGFFLNHLPADYKPIAQPVDDFHRNNKIGSIFELAVGKGKLLVSGYDIGAFNPVSRQLKYSLLRYMRSPKFSPSRRMDVAELKRMFPDPDLPESPELAERFKNALLYVNAGGNLAVEKKNLSWDRKRDAVTIGAPDSYLPEVEGLWKEGIKTAWHGKDISLRINCPEGMLGSLYVHFQDWNNVSRTGSLTFEGRKRTLGKHSGKGRWVKFHVMREDSNDGKLILKTKSETGPNLMITRVVLVKE
ncbi:glycoside hydrolase family 2 TIM barrel-domain containing protein [Fulvitalea axinellae]